MEKEEDNVFSMAHTHTNKVTHRSPPMCATLLSSLCPADFGSENVLTTPNVQDWVNTKASHKHARNAHSVRAVSRGHFWTQYRHNLGYFLLVPLWSIALISTSQIDQAHWTLDNRDILVLLSSAKFSCAWAQIFVGFFPPYPITSLKMKDVHIPNGKLCISGVVMGMCT